MLVFLSAYKRYTVRLLLLNENPWVLPWKKAFSVKPKLLFRLFTSLFTNAVKTVKTVFFILWEIPINLRPIENLNLFGIFCVVSISLLHAEAVARTEGFPSNFRSYTRTLAQWRLRRLFQCRYKITEKRAQAFFLFLSVPRAPRPSALRPSVFPPSRIERDCSRGLVYLLGFQR